MSEDPFGGAEEYRSQRPARGWKPPWHPGQRKADCTACGTTVIASTVGEDGRCVQCVHTGKQPEESQMEMWE